MNNEIRRLVKYVYYFLPEGLKNYIVKKKQKKDLQEAWERAKRTKVTKEEVAKIIEGLAIGDSDIILHTSMMNIGKVQGGVKWIANCLFEKIDLSRHTLLVSALPYRGKFKDYLQGLEVFDVRKAPVEMGGINEYIKSLPEAVRSVHPTHSVVAIGCSAKEYVGSHHIDKTPFGENSPYYKIIKNRGKALMFGATWNHLTCVHAVEDMIGPLFPKNFYSSQTYHIKCINDSGECVYVETPYHNPLLSCIRNILPLRPKLIANGIMEITTIGEAEIAIIDLYKFAIFYLNEVEQGWSIYGRIKVSQQLREKIEEIKKIL